MRVVRRIVTKPRIQVPLQVVIVAGWALIGVSSCTDGHVAAERLRARMPGDLSAAP
jgi:hypothetical protein